VAGGERGLGPGSSLQKGKKEQGAERSSIRKTNKGKGLGDEERGKGGRKV